MLAILLAGMSMGTLHDRRDFLGSLAWLVVWGGAQQWILQTVVLRDAQRVTSRRAGIVLAAGLFAAVHLPNPFLAPVTFVSGLLWCATYTRHPNILPLALSHGLGTLAILYAFDPAFTGRLRIGYSYLLLDRWRVAWDGGRVLIFARRPPSVTAESRNTPRIRIGSDPSYRKRWRNAMISWRPSAVS